MSQRYLGGIITANPTAPTLSSASGVWTLEQQFQYSQTIQPEIIGNSLRFRASASAYMNRTNGSPTAGTKYTVSMWVKRGQLGRLQGLIGVYPASSASDSNTQIFEFNASDQLQFTGFSTIWRITTAVYRDPSAWYHIVLAYDSTQATASNRELLYVNGVQVTSFATSNDVAQNTVSPLNSSGSVVYLGQEGAAALGVARYFDGYMAETYFIDGQALTPSSFGGFDSNGVWQPLAYTGTYGTNGFYLDFSNNVDTLLLGLNPAVASNYFQYSEQLDNAYWSKLNVTVAANTTDTTDPLGTNTADKLTMSTAGNSYVYRNSGITATTQWVLSGYFKAGTVSSIELYISSSGGADGGIGVFTLTGSGSASFSPLNGSSGTASIQFVGNGWYRCVLACRGSSGQNAGTIDAGSTGTAYGWGMQLEIGSTVGTYTQTVASSIINNWTPNNISLTAGSTYDWMLDSPTNWSNGTGNGVGNYCVLNPLFASQTSVASGSSGTAPTISNGNQTVTAAGGSVQTSAIGTFGVTTGKWYCEYIATAVNGTGDLFGFIQTFNGGLTLNGYRSTGYIYNQGAATSATTWTTGDVIGMALDCDAGTLACYKNNTLIATVTITGGVTAPMFPIVWFRDASGAGSINFGQRPFTYTPPTGFKALNTLNLPDPNITNGAQYMAATLWTGDATSSRAINNGTNNNIGTTFKPDLVWTKARSGASNLSHLWVDSVRGATLTLSSDQTAAEYTLSTGVTAFNSNGFQIGTWPNSSGQTEVGWQWQAGQGTTSSNTSGSITSTVSVNATAGFSIVTASASGTSPVTMGHGLGVAPSFIIGRVRNNTANWYVYSSSFSSQDYLVLNSTAAKATSSNIWDSAPTSTVLTVGNPQNGWNGGTAGSYNYVLYCWAQVAGFSKFGSYTGNGSTDGPFVYLGFRPRYILFKRTDTTGSWVELDTARLPANVANYALYANLSDAETLLSAGGVDINSNGFKHRGTDSNINASGGTYIYAAFAENPFKISRAR